MAADAQQHTSEEVQQLRAELHRETQMREMLEKSAEELSKTAEQLEKRHSTIDEESNEWKTRFEIQEEINEQLARHAAAMKTYIDRSKHLFTQQSATSPITPRDEYAEPSEERLAELNKEKTSLQSQLAELLNRLEQESKAFQKVNDERRQYLAEINAAKMAAETFQRRQQQPQSDDEGALVKAATPGYETHSARSVRNIPDGHRIIDPKKGPIKRTAAVKSLPKIEGSSSPALQE